MRHVDNTGLKSSYNYNSMIAESPSSNNNRKKAVGILALTALALGGLHYYGDLNQFLFPGLHTPENLALEKRKEAQGLEKEATTSKNGSLWFDAVVAYEEADQLMPNIKDKKKMLECLIQSAKAGYKPGYFSIDLYKNQIHENLDDIKKAYYQNRNW